MKTSLSSVLTAVSNSRKTDQALLNRAGAPTYRRSLKEQVLGVLSTGTFSDTFYVSAEELVAETLEVLVQARTECPEFLARALVWAREEGLMKTLPVFGLAVLSAGTGVCKNLFLQAFPRVVKIPDDLRSFVTIVKSGVIPGRRGLGGVTVEPVREFLRNLSEYHALKYGSANSKDVTLADMIRMAHPKPADAVTAERFAWLLEGKRALGNTPEWNPQIRAFEALKRAATEDERSVLIREGRLPFEVVLPTVKAAGVAVWSELLRQAPYMNLLRNLVTFTRHGVFRSEENVRYAVAKLTAPEAVRKSRQLPFRFLSAWREYAALSEADSRLTDALRVALELSFANMPSFGNLRVALGPDVSGSMSTVPLSQGSDTYCIDIAGIFTGALLKRIEGRAILLPFERGVRHDHRISARDDIMVTAQRIRELGGGGTAVGAPIEHLLDRKIEIDVFVGMTDNEDWAYGQDHETSGSFISLWRRYKRDVAPNARAFLVTLAPYRDAVAPQGERDVHFIYGWSDSVLRYIGLNLDSGASQVEAVSRLPL